MTSFFFGNKNQDKYFAPSVYDKQMSQIPPQAVGVATATYFGYTTCPELTEKSIVKSMNSCLQFNSPFSKPEVTIYWSKDTGFLASDKKTLSEVISVRLQHVGIGHLQSRKGGRHMKYFGLVCWDTKLRDQICHTFKVHGDAVKFFKSIQTTFEELQAQTVSKQKTQQETAIPVSPSFDRKPVATTSAPGAAQPLRQQQTQNQPIRNSAPRKQDVENVPGIGQWLTEKTVSPVKRPSSQDFPGRPAKRASLTNINTNVPSPTVARKTIDMNANRFGGFSDIWDESNI